MIEGCDIYRIKGRFDIPEIWIFTGRIKYTKKKFETQVSFEIAYERNHADATIFECFRQWIKYGFKFFLLPKKTVREWIPSYGFQNKPKKPEFTIYECAK